MRKSRFGIPAFCLILVALLASAGLTVVAWRARAIGSARQELARLGLEDAARRVAESVRAVSNLRTLAGSVALSRAKALAEIIVCDPTVLAKENRGRFEALAKDLDVDELHVTDGKGILIRSFPSAYEGLDMAGSKQSAAFMPAIGDPSFELVQEPQRKGHAVGDRRLDEAILQYAGVARRDKPGIVQVGCRAERLVEAKKLADVGLIASTVHVGRQGRVTIVPLPAGCAPSSVPRLVEDATSGRSKRVFETACEGNLITVEMPEPHPFLASERFGHVLFVADLVLLLLLLLVLPGARRILAEDAQALRTLFGADGTVAHRPFWRRWLANPLALVGLALFALLLAVFWFLSSLQATRAANDTLARAAADIDGDLRDCVDSLLFFQGDAICSHYGSPEKMTTDDLAVIMDRYGLDELNVVDGKGIVIRGALAEIGYDMGSKPKTAEFNRLLDGRTKTFSQRFRAPVENPNGVKRKYAGVAFDPPARGYLQLGLSETRLKSRLDYFIAGIADGWHIGDAGFFLIARAETGEIVSAGRDFGEAKTLAALGFDTGRADATPDRSFEMSIGGVPCLCRSGIVNRYHRYVAAIPLDEVRGGTRRLVVSAGVILLAVLVLVITFMTRLSDLVLSLRTYIVRDRQQRERDLAVARTIQTSSLPVRFPDTPQFRIYAQMDTAREVGGDFYDFWELPSGRWLVLVADVSGKGIPAAMFMMKAKAIVRASVAETTDLATAIAEANARLAEQNDAEMFVTAWIGLFDPATGTVEYVCAGHNPPLVRRADGSVEWIRARGGLALAAMDGMRYRPATLALRPGDSLFLYTDGVTEAMNVKDELYGEERLEKALARAGRLFVTDIQADLNAFVAGAEQSDDITLLALDFKCGAEK